MLVAIGRYQFNYLFKQDSVRADLNTIYWYDKENLLAIQQNNVGRAIVELDDILPPFEEEHEVILLEYDQKIWEYNDKTLEFSGVLSIIPLTIMGKRLLTGKLSDKIKLGEPLFEKTIEGVKRKRDLKLRRVAAKKLLSLFQLEDPPREAVALIEQAIAKILTDSKTISDKENIFLSLFKYNTTERFIPEGNIEHLCKIAVLARIHLGQDPSLVQQGPFYKDLLNVAQALNRKGIIEAYSEFNQLSTESIASTQKVREAINSNLNFDMLFVAYVFFAFRRVLNKSEYDLSFVKKDIQNLRGINPIVASIVMYAIGTAFSFDQLYESLHKLVGAPLLGGLKWQGAEQAKTILTSSQDKAKISESLTKTDISTSSNQDEVALVQEESLVVSKTPENRNTKNNEVEKAEREESSKSSYAGIPVMQFVDFLEKEIAPKKAKDIQSIIKAYSSEFKNGLTFKWIEEKLLSSNSSKKTGKLTQKEITSIKSFFNNNKALD